MKSPCMGPVSGPSTDEVNQKIAEQTRLFYCISSGDWAPSALLNEALCNTLCLKWGVSQAC